jgi:dihydroneopterin aldolase
VVDAIRLKGVTLFPHLGVTSWEKMGVQKVSCDVDLSLDLAAAAKADRMAAALDYQQVYDVVQQVAKARKYHLIEALAQAILTTLLDRFPPIARAAIRVRKSALPFDAHLECVEVEMERTR